MVMRRRSSQTEDVENIRNTLRELGYPVHEAANRSTSSSHRSSITLDEGEEEVPIEIAVRTKNPPSKLWAIGMCLVVAIFVSAASVVLQGQQPANAAGVVKTNFKSEMVEDRSLEVNGKKKKPIFDMDGASMGTDKGSGKGNGQNNGGGSGNGGNNPNELDDRKVPDNAPPNANKAAYAQLLNEQDIIFLPADVSPSNSNIGHGQYNHVKPPKRSKGASLLSEGIDEVTILPENMNDCDSTGMAEDASTCANALDASMEGGGVAVEKKKDDDEEVPEEEQYGEESYAQDLETGQENEEGDEPTFHAVGEDRRRLNIPTRGIGTFAPLECNAGGLKSAEECDANPDGMFSDLVTAAAAGTGKVVVPCGMCYKVSEETLLLCLYGLLSWDDRTNLIFLCI